MAASDDLIKAVGANIQEKASLVWSAAQRPPKSLLSSI